MDKRVAWLALLAFSAVLAGCAENKQREREIDLDLISRWLPGTYNNSVQAQMDVQQGIKPAHDAVELAIVPVDSIAVGRNAFYLQEMDADNPRRVFSQRIVIFNATDKGVIESVATLVDPLRWRDAQRDPDIFSGMTPKDYSVIAGCELTWTRVGGAAAYLRPKDKEAARQAMEDRRFTASSDPKRCKTTSHAVMGLVEVEMRAELSAGEYAQGELQYDSSGTLLQGNKEAALYRYRKVGH